MVCYTWMVIQIEMSKCELYHTPFSFSWCRLGWWFLRLRCHNGHSLLCHKQVNILCGFIVFKHFHDIGIALYSNQTISSCNTNNRLMCTHIPGQTPSWRNISYPCPFPFAHMFLSWSCTLTFKMESPNIRSHGSTI